MHLWAGVFGDEWFSNWTYPNHIVNDGEVIKVAGLSFQVVDVGAGGDCDANSFWLLNEDDHAAFIGDFIYHNNHSYMADGSILRWLANLEKFDSLLKQYNNFYVGHGSSCQYPALRQQRDYFLAYCSNVLEQTKGTGSFNEESRNAFIKQMIEKYPSYGSQFMIGLAADTVGAELA